MKFIDLFAGLGGFNIALTRLGHKCVFSSEINEELRALYKLNFGSKSNGDIREIRISKIPSHDILCAGFPCQPFSKAGKQHGLKCPEYGDLFDYIVKILHNHKPAYFILENVANLERHNQGRTWRKMGKKLNRVGYEIEAKRLSPHQFGVPQIRDRLYVVGSRNGFDGFSWPMQDGKGKTSISSALEKSPKDARGLSPQTLECLEVWQEFLDKFPKNEELPSFPIWSMEFGATYPYKYKTPFAVRRKTLHRYCGSHGLQLGSLSPKVRWLSLPSYARTEEKRFPDWKIDFISQNRELYAKHKKWIDHWLPSILQFPPSLQKLEWNCKGDKRNIWRHVIQFRASGVRIKRLTTSPSLVAMTTTQVPIIGWQKRYMTPRECANLQSFKELKNLPKSSTKAYKSLGNAVNSDVVELIARSLIK